MSEELKLLFFQHYARTQRKSGQTSLTTGNLVESYYWLSTLSGLHKNCSSSCNKSFYDLTENSLTPLRRTLTTTFYYEIDLKQSFDIIE